MKNVTQDKIRLKIDEYKAVVDGKEKKLCLIGEYHVYNLPEHNLSEKLAEGYNNYASEITVENQNNQPLSDMLYGVVLSMFKVDLISAFFGKKGYPNLSLSLGLNGQKVHSLEESPWKPFNFHEKIKLLTDDGAFKSCGDFNKDYEMVKKSPSYEPLVKRRDKIMADNLAKLLKKEDTNDLLATVGRAHLEGVTKYLSEQVKLVEAEKLQ